MYFTPLTIKTDNFGLKPWWTATTSTRAWQGHMPDVQRAANIRRMRVWTPFNLRKRCLAVCFPGFVFSHLRNHSFRVLNLVQDATKWPSTATTPRSGVWFNWLTVSSLARIWKNRPGGYTDFWFLVGLWLIFKFCMPWESWFRTSRRKSWTISRGSSPKLESLVETKLSIRWSDWKFFMSRTQSDSECQFNETN